MNENKNQSSKMPLILVVGAISIILVVATLYRQPSDKELAQHAESVEWQKKECAKEIAEAVGKTSSRDAAEAAVRNSEHAKIACAGLEMNGVKVIQ